LGRMARILVLASLTIPAPVLGTVAVSSAISPTVTVSPAFMPAVSPTATVSPTSTPAGSITIFNNDAGSACGSTVALNGGAFETIPAGGTYTFSNLVAGQYNLGIAINGTWASTVECGTFTGGCGWIGQNGQSEDRTLHFDVTVTENSNTMVTLNQYLGTILCGTPYNQYVDGGVTGFSPPNLSPVPETVTPMVTASPTATADAH
jgi:hypothetical protein